MHYFGQGLNVIYVGLIGLTVVAQVDIKNSGMIMPDTDQ